jgi:hypothetical protein
LAALAPTGADFLLENISINPFMWSPIDLSLTGLDAEAA